MQNMRENMQNLAKYALKYAANMRNVRHICEFSHAACIISAYAISKTQLYAEKHAICGFSQNMRSHVRIYPVSLSELKNHYEVRL